MTGRPDRTNLLRWLPLAAAAFACDGAAARAATQPAAIGALPSVTVVDARRGTLVDRATLIGTFVAREEAMVTPQVDGLPVTAILVEEGDHVAAGQVLARLSRDAIEASLAENAANTDRAEASIASAEGAIEEARANRIEAAAALVRADALLAHGDLSHEVFDQRQAAADIADARLRAATDQLAVARADLALAGAQHQALAVDLARTDLVAPVAGLVIRRTARLGAVVGTASAPLFRIAEDGAIEMAASVPETELARVRPGEAAAVFSVERRLAGHVRLVSPEIDATTRLGSVRIALDDRSATPPPVGSFARAAVTVATRTGVVVPLSAVLFAPGGPVVDVAPRVPGQDAGAATRVVTRRVVVGLSDDREAEIDAGLADGDRVVAVSGAFLRDGDRVLPVAAADPAAGAGAGMAATTARTD